MAVQIALDVFPAQVRTPGAVHDKARVVVADGRAHVFVLGAEGRPELAAAAALVDTDVGRNWPYRLSTDAGDWTAERGGGCGCGNPLKRAPRDQLLGLAHT